MRLSAEDKLEIHEVIALHGHLCDAEAYDRFDEVFAPDLEVDASALGLAPLPPRDPSRPRLETYIAVAHERGAGSTVAMHVTSIIVRADGEAGARAWSKGFTVAPDGTIASYTYEDRLVRAAGGWRIRHRTIAPRRTPGGGAEPLAGH
jgi:hypothetical protein